MKIEWTPPYETKLLTQFHLFGLAFFFKYSTFQFEDSKNYDNLYFVHV